MPDNTIRPEDTIAKYEEMLEQRDQEVAALKRKILVLSAESKGKDAIINQFKSDLNSRRGGGSSEGEGAKRSRSLEGGKAAADKRLQEENATLSIENRKLRIALNSREASFEVEKLRLENELRLLKVKRGGGKAKTLTVDLAQPILDRVHDFKHCLDTPVMLVDSCSSTNSLTVCQVSIVMKSDRRVHASQVVECKCVKDNSECTGPEVSRRASKLTDFLALLSMTDPGFRGSAGFGEREVREMSLLMEEFVQMNKDLFQDVM